MTTPLIRYVLKSDGSAWYARGRPLILTSGALPGDVPTAPGSVHTTSVSTSAVALAWTLPTSDNPGTFPVTGINVRRQPGNVLLTSSPLAATATTFTDTTVGATSAYRYDVTGINLPGEGPRGSVLVQTPDGTIAGGAPGQVLALTNTGTVISWSPPATTGGAGTYKSPHVGGLYASGYAIGGHIWSGNNTPAWKNMYATPSSATASTAYDPSAYLATLNTGLYNRLHFHGAGAVPPWTMLDPSAGGFGAESSSLPGVLVTNGQHGGSARTMWWWTDEAIAEYSRFIHAMGAAMDSLSYIVSVNVPGPSTFYDECFILGGQTTADALHATYVQDPSRGYTADKGRASIMAAVAATIDAFPNTLVELSTHSSREWVDSSGNLQGAGTASGWPDTANGARQIMNDLDNLYGDHLCFTDYGLGPGDLNSNRTPSTQYAPATDLTTADNQYDWMWGRSNLGRPVAFQGTYVPGGGGSGNPPTTQQLTDGTQAAVQLGGMWMEHASYNGASGQNLTSTQQTNFNTALAANAPTYTGSANTPTFYEVIVDNGTPIVLGPPVPGTLSKTLSGLASGDHYVLVRAGNSAGLGPASIVDVVTV